MAAFFRKHQFHGFLLHWEYPIGVAEEHTNLAEEMKEAFAKEVKKNRCATSPAHCCCASRKKKTTDGSYNVQSIGNFDLLFLMSYDLHGFRKVHGKFYPTEGETTGIDEFTANYWLSKGVPKRKAIIGISVYSRGWTLGIPSRTATIETEGSRPLSPSITNPVGGTAAYWEICKYMKESGGEIMDGQGVGTYMRKWLKKKGYGGAFKWTLDFDDFKGMNCGKGPNALLNATSNEMR
ncbi:unnamed protein product [Litomosoides sigmodontis]|uniref:GH18 domain-containing protein n=1 Tax=Litomosoides sigmodontis TaxID=42156 RepID=A0A3P6T914_LITSI|nr:unnamed protein product [Litomosoides sigmodontis]